MSHRRLFHHVLGLAACAVLVLPAAGAAEGAHDAFERLKALEGTWRAERPDGDVSTKVYTVTAGGSTVSETYARQGDNDHDMLTVYHLEGDRLVLTHFCSVGNRPKMVADGGSKGTITFEMDTSRGPAAVGLSDLDEGHMRRAVFELSSEDTMTQRWTFFQEGAPVHTEVESFVRVR